ncbi:hypothetical protein HK097_011092, partial [Rhizophlyctis rosea]
MQQQAEQEVQAAKEMRAKRKLAQTQFIRSIPAPTQNRITVFRRASAVGNLEIAIDNYMELQKSNWLPLLALRDFSSIFFTLAKTQEGTGIPTPRIVALLRTVFDDMLKIFPSEMSAQSTLTENVHQTFIRLYLRSQNTSSLLSMSDHVLKNGTLQTHNLLLHALLTESLHQKVIDLFSHMRLNPDITPDCQTYAIVIRAHAYSDDVPSAKQLFTEMIDSGLEPDIRLIFHVVQAYGKAGDLESIQNMLPLMQTYNLKPTRQIYNAIMHAYAKAGLQSEALEIFKALSLEYESQTEEALASGKLPETRLHPDTVSYNILIDMFAKSGSLEPAEQLFQQMQAEGIEPDVVTFASLINACVMADDMPRAEEYVEVLNAKGHPPNINLLTSLIRGYKRAHQKEKAIQTYDRLLSLRLRPDRHVFRSLLGALDADAQLCEKYYSEMRSFAIAPDDVILDQILRAHLYGGSGIGVIRRRFRDGLRSARGDIGVCNVFLQAELKYGMTTGQAVKQVYEEIFVKRGIKPNVKTLQILVDDCWARILGAGTEKEGEGG